MIEKNRSEDEKRIKELVKLLNEASEAYYAKDEEILDNLTYDKLYLELEKLEKKSGIYLSDSPTQNVGYEAVDYLPKMMHEHPMLSLDKTKSVEELKSFIGENKTLLSWKMDGLTVVLTYTDGQLRQAVTRGNGYEGEIVTNNAKQFRALPLKIPFEKELIIRGEAYISYSDFERINTLIEDVDSKYKNPRNLCSGSVRQLDSSITAKRNVRFKVFSLVRAEGVDFNNSHEKEFEWLKSLGFDTVEYRTVTAASVDEAIEYFSEEIKTNDFPSDGLVALYDDIEYGRSLGQTAKFPRNAYAFKWSDEEKTTHLLEVEWSPSRTGLINPIAVFEPVELEGTTVSRASLHNISILKGLKLGIGDEIKVYKANMIIPQLSENLTMSDSLQIPDRCPACGGKAIISDTGGVQTLICTNSECPAKQIKAFELFVSRDAMNIEGMSESTLEKFIAHGFIRSFADIFKIEKHKEEITALEGFGDRSYERMAAAIEKARKTSLVRLIYAMGIPNIGLAGAKLIARHFNNDPERIRTASVEELCQIDGIGSVIAENYVKWWQNSDNSRQFDELTAIVDIEKAEEKGHNDNIDGKVFVITGSLEHFENRNALKELIESLGGKVTGSVSAKTDFLINNDISSNSSKNKKARELNIPVISEEDFLQFINNGGK